MKRTIFTAILVAGALIATSALAIDNNGPVDKAMAAGVVGEQADGYLGFVRPPTAAQADLQRRINEINIRRRGVFNDTAKTNGETEDRVALLSALRQITKTPNGEYFQDTTKTWCVKSPDSQVMQTADDIVVIRCAPSAKAN
ncbi:MAG: YdbL family protein [Hyphomonadaceae bacterium]